MDGTGGGPGQPEAEPATAGVLVLAGTPIGDLADASPALRRELTRADLIAAEDTRRAGLLLARLEIDPVGRLVSYFEGNEATRTPELVDALLAGRRVAVITDAGMPSVSDPGYRLVRAAVAADVRVSAVPGPSAVLTALAVSGLPTDRFCFEGFLPRKAGERSRRLADLVGETRTMIFFEAPHRCAETLAAMAETFGAERPGAVCRELTKTYEQVRRGGLAELATWATEGVRGEVTLVIGGATAVEPDLVTAVGEVAELVGSGTKLKPAVAQVAAAAGIRKNVLYDAVLQSRDVG